MLKTDIAIRGTGAAAEDVVLRVVNPTTGGGGNGLKVEGSVIGKIENLTLSHVGKVETDSRPPVVLLDQRGARLTFTNVIIRDGVGHGVFVGKGAEVQLYDVKIVDNAWSGIVVDGSDGLNTPSKLTTGAINDFTRVETNLDHGIKVRNGATATLQSTYFSNNATDGIRVESKAKVEVVNVALSGNGRYGISVDGTGSRAEVTNAIGVGNGTAVTFKSNEGVLIESGNDWN